MDREYGLAATWRRIAGGLTLGSGRARAIGSTRARTRSWLE